MHLWREAFLLACDAQPGQLQAPTLYLRMKASMPFLDSMAARSFSGLEDGDDFAGDRKACMYMKRAVWQSSPSSRRPRQ